jgi:peptidoglycan-N-acetylglucosamine deacetylase
MFFRVYHPVPFLEDGMAFALASKIKEDSSIMARSNLLLLTGILSAFFLMISSTASHALEANPVPIQLRNSIREVKIPDNRKVLAFTFDLCEAPSETAGFDSELVDFLAKNSVNATFFAGGKWMRSHPQETMRLMADPLFEIGNHSWSHANFRHLGPDTAKEQIVRTQEEYSRLREMLVARLRAEGASSNRIEAIPPLPGLFRFPYGACTSESLGLLAEQGLYAIQWNIVSGDPAKNRTSEGIIGTVLSQVRPGSIIIFHANGKGRGTFGALRVLIPKLRSQGYEFTTVSELLASGNPVSVPECYELNPGDTLKYDRPVSRAKSQPRNQ